MQKLNRVQRHLLSFGYPMPIVQEYKTNSKNYKEEVRQNVYDTMVESKRQKRY